MKKIKRKDEKLMRDLKVNRDLKKKHKEKRKKSITEVDQMNSDAQTGDLEAPRLDIDTEKIRRKKKRRHQNPGHSVPGETDPDKNYFPVHTGTFKDEPGKPDVPKNGQETDLDDIYEISSGDDDCSIGMKKWITEYHQCRPGLQVLQQRMDDLIVAHEQKLEQERREREAREAEDGWTVVVHHKGRKKTGESGSGTTVGSTSQVIAKKIAEKAKPKEVGPDFYQFQRKEARRNEIWNLQKNFAEDKKKIQQLRANRKFKPY